MKYCNALSVKLVHLSIPSVLGDKAWNEHHWGPGLGNYPGKQLGARRLPNAKGPSPTHFTFSVLTRFETSIISPMV